MGVLVVTDGSTVPSKNIGFSRSSSPASDSPFRNGNDAPFAAAACAAAANCSGVHVRTNFRAVRLLYGPVLIQIEYQIDPEHRAAFLRAIHAVEATRRRNGAARWRVYRDLSGEGRFVERYIITSWSEYVRLRTRMTVADHKIQDRVTELQRKDVPIRVSRLLGVNEREFLESERHHEAQPQP